MVMPTTVTNFATNPRPLGALDSGAGAWEYVAGVGEVGTSAVVASVGPVGLPGIARRTITTAKTSGPAGWRYSEAAGGGVGSARDVALYVRPSGTVNVTLRVQFLMGGVDAGTTNMDAVSCPANTWTRLLGYGAAEGPFDEIRAWAFTTGAVPVGTSDAACAFIDPGDSTPLTEPYPSVFLYPSELIFPL